MTRPDEGTSAGAGRPIKLMLADVDGTLVTNDKVLTDRAIAAVGRLHDAGITFAVTSGRPPRGMAMLVEPLALDTPLAAFNGGLFVAPDMTVIESARSRRTSSSRSSGSSTRSASTPGSTAGADGSCST